MWCWWPAHIGPPQYTYEVMLMALQELMVWAGWFTFTTIPNKVKLVTSSGWIGCGQHCTKYGGLMWCWCPGLCGGVFAVPWFLKNRVGMNFIWIHMRVWMCNSLSGTHRSNNTRWFLSWWIWEELCGQVFVVLWRQFIEFSMPEWIWVVYGYIWEVGCVILCLVHVEATIQGNLCPCGLWREKHSQIYVVLWCQFIDFSMPEWIWVVYGYIWVVGCVILCLAILKAMIQIALRWWRQGVS